MHDFVPASGNNQDQICIREGQKLRLDSQGANGWTRGTNVVTNRTGWFPTSYISASADPRSARNVAEKARMARNRRIGR